MNQVQCLNAAGDFEESLAAFCSKQNKTKGKNDNMFKF